MKDNNHLKEVTNMPNRDQSGPQGQDQGTGKCQGGCSTGQGKGGCKGRGRGCGKGEGDNRAHFQSVPQDYGPLLPGGDRGGKEQRRGA